MDADDCSLPAGFRWRIISDRSFSVAGVIAVVALPTSSPGNVSGVCAGVFRIVSAVGLIAIKIFRPMRFADESRRGPFQRQPIVRRCFTFRTARLMGYNEGFRSCLEQVHD
jgi:hypothetical protein